MGVGEIAWDNTDLAAQIESENGTTWTGNIGLISASDVIRANTNIAQCGSININNKNQEICKTTNYLVPELGYYWTISPTAGRTDTVFYVNNRYCNVNHYYANGKNEVYSDFNVMPAVYLIPDIKLNGSGTSSDPYTIS